MIIIFAIPYIIVRLHEGSTENQINKLKRNIEIIRVEKELERTDLTDKEISQLQKEHYDLLHPNHYYSIRECVHDPKVECDEPIGDIRICSTCKKRK